MSDPLTPKVLFSHRVDQLESEQQARELLGLVRAGQLGAKFDPAGEGMSVLLGRAWRLEEEGRGWRWDLALELARLGTTVNSHHFMLILDRPEQIKQLLEVYVENQTDLVGTKVLLLELADAALTNTYIDTLRVVEQIANRLEFDLYRNGMGMFLCHLCGNRYSTDNDVEEALASLDVLSEKPHFDVNKTYAGKSPLFYTKDPEIVRWLIGRGANINLRGPKQETIIGEAWKNHACDEIFQILIDNGADLDTGPDLAQVQWANRDPLSPSYPYLTAALKRKALGEWIGVDVDVDGETGTSPSKM